MFIKHNNVTSPCPFDSGGYWLLSTGIYGLLHAFLKIRKLFISTTSDSEQWQQPEAQELIKLPLRVKELKTTLNQAMKSTQSGGFGYYKLTGEV